MSQININKNRYWVGVLYPENMIENWEDELEDLLQLPFCYCIHDKDLDKDGVTRKNHVHMIIAFSNTTTYNHAFRVFSMLNAEGRIAVNKIEACINIRYAYNYLIHDTDNCRKKGKYQYSPECRIGGNTFDIGNFEQLSLSEKNNLLKDLCKIALYNGFTNFADFFEFVIDDLDMAYFDLLKTYSGLLERIIKGNYLKESK
jgi:hypothetical protein